MKHQHDYERHKGLMTRVGVLRFIQMFDLVGGTNFGACGMDDQTADLLDKLRIIEVWYSKPYNHKARVGRRFRKVTRGAFMPRLAKYLREELRQRNLASIAGLSDGHGRVAFMQDWKTRRTDVKEAAQVAWARLVSDLFSTTGLGRSGRSYISTKTGST